MSLFDLLYTNLTEAILIKTSTGVRTQLWYYPSRQDCLVCHTANALASKRTCATCCGAS